MGESHHYRQRCQERRIPTDARHVVRRHGRPYLGRRGEHIYHLDAYRAWRARLGGLDLDAYLGVAVVQGRGGVAITAFRVDDEAARLRWREIP
jgi:hypothetical protein